MLNEYWAQSWKQSGMGKKRKLIELSNYSLGFPLRNGKNTKNQLNNNGSDDKQLPKHTSKILSNDPVAANPLGPHQIKSNRSTSRLKFEQWSPLAKKVCSRSLTASKKISAALHDDDVDLPLHSPTTLGSKMKNKIRNAFTTGQTSDIVVSVFDGHGQGLESQLKPNENEMCGDISKCQIDSMTMDTETKGDIIPLKPLFFELPAAGNAWSLIGRKWLFTEIHAILNIEQGRGVMVCGGPGSGKSSIALQLVEASCFGRRNNVNSWAHSDVLSTMADQLVAYHFCQVESNKTCLVPEFVHSIAAQLCQAPRLSPYKEYLMDNATILHSLCLEQCQVNPSKALMSGILEPLNFLQRLNKVGADSCLIVIDSLCEAESHRCDSGDTISTFLAKHILRFPTWLKVILTARTSHQNLISLIPFHKISLDGNEGGVAMDMTNYIGFRMNASKLIKESILSSSCSKRASAMYDIQATLMRFADGNILFLKLALDLIEEGYLLVNSSTTKALPRRLSDLFLMACNKRFSTSGHFELVKPIMATCLASLTPLNLLEIYHSVNSLRAQQNMTWENFMEIFKGLQGLLLERSDGTYMLFHSTFREWLLRRDGNEPKDYLCHARIGHAAIAFRLSRIEAPLNNFKTLELAHHILKAHMYKKMPCRSKAHAMWLVTSSCDLSETLGSNATIFYPNLKVARLLLMAGASPNQTTNCYGKAPIIACAAAAAQYELVALLLEFGANINALNTNGETALHLAILAQHLEIATLLVKLADVALADNLGRTALFLAAKAGDESLVKLLLEHDASLEDGDIHGMKPLDVAVQGGHLDLIKLFLKKGAKLGPNTWVLGAKEPNIIQVILRKVFEDGFMLSKKGLVKEAIHRYEYALRKMPDFSDYDLDKQKVFNQMKFLLTMELSHCRSKIYAETENISVENNASGMKLNPRCQYKSWFPQLLQGPGFCSNVFP